MGKYHFEVHYRFWYGFLLPITVSVLDAIEQTFDAESSTHNATLKWPKGTGRSHRPRIFK